MDQEQEFEFRARAEQEQRLRAQQAQPSQTGGATGSWGKKPVDPDAHARSLAAYDRVTKGGLLDQAIGEVTGSIPEAAIYYGHKAAAGAAGFVAGAPHALEGLSSGDDQGARTFADVAGKVAGAVDTNPKTHGGKALVGAGNWVLEQLAKGAQWVGEGAADIARSAGASSDNVARIGALGEAASSVLAPSVPLEAAQIPITVGRRVLTGADAATEARFAGTPDSMGPPLRTDPTLNMGTATTEATPAMIRSNGARLPSVGATDMGGRIDPSLGAPSAAAQPPLMADTRPSMSVLDRIIANATEKTLAKGKLTVKDETHAELMKQGYVFPPSHVDPSFVGNKLESIAGKAALDQQATKLNQAVTDRLAAKAARIPEDTPITMESLKEARYVIEEPYRRVAATSPTAASALEDLKQARSDAGDSWRHYNRSADPSSKAKAKQLDAEAALLETMIDEEATRLGQPGLLQELRDARKASAQNRDIERAFNPATGEVDARTLGRMWAKDKGQKMTGEGAIIARFANTAKKIARPGADVPTPGVGKTEAAASAALGLTGHATGLGWWPAGMVLAGGPTRALLLSRYMQKPKTAPGPGMTVKLAEFANRGDPLSLGAASAINQTNFSTQDPLGLNQ